MNYEQALGLINKTGIKNSLGRYNSRVLNQKWFVKNNLIELYDIIINTTTAISSRSFGERLWAFERLPIPLCECGNPCKKYDNGDKWSNCCSKSCSVKSKFRANKISNTKSKQDHTVSNIKRKQTMLEKYGVETNSQRAEIKKIIGDKLSKRQITPDKLAKLNDVNWMYDQYIIQKRSAVDIADQIGCDYSTVLSRVTENNWEVRQCYNKSLAEKQIVNFLTSIGVVSTSPTNLLNGKQEIDVYVESHKFGIEVDGLRYHSYSQFESSDQKNKHLSKSITANKNGIDLIHVTDYQWYNKQDIVKSIIKSKLKKNKRIHARKCEVVVIDTKTAKEFINNNHIQGYCACSLKIGLIYEGELVAVSTFGTPRYDKTHDWELIRFCNQLNTSVVGGFSKLLKSFCDNHTGRLISYADRMRSNGNVYLQNGFTLVRETTPGYFWTDSTHVIPRTSWSRKTAEYKLKKYDPSLSEAENMFANGYRRFWDCGQLVFSLNI